MILISLKTKVYDKVLIGNIFKFKEITFILLSIYSMVLAIGLLYINVSKCIYLEIIKTAFLYAFWGIVGIIITVLCAFISNIF